LDEEKQADEKLTEITAPLLDEISADGEMEMEEPEETPQRKSVASSGRPKRNNARRAAR
jgi:hypothetical protein